MQMQKPIQDHQNDSLSPKLRSPRSGAAATCALDTVDAVEGPAAEPASARIVSWSLLLSWVMLALGAYTAITTAVLMYRTCSPVLFSDQWVILATIKSSGGSLNL